MVLLVVSEKKRVNKRCTVYLWKLCVCVWPYGDRWALQSSYRQEVSKFSEMVRYLHYGGNHTASYVPTKIVVCLVQI